MDFLSSLLRRSLVSFFLIVSLGVSAQKIGIIEDPIDGGGGVTVTISGPSSASVNQTKTYSVSVSGGLHASTSYTASGGSITSQSKTSVSVKWTSTGSRYIRATANVSGSLHTKTKYVTVTAPLIAGSISASTATSICSGTDPGTINNSSSASGGSGSISYQWQQYGGGGPVPLEGPGDPPIGGSWTNVSGATGSSYNPPKLYSGTQYRRRASSGGQTAYSNTITYSMVTPTAGSISYSGGNVNAGGNPSKITGTTVSGASYQWQRKTTGGYSNISGATGRDYDPGTQNVSTTYRRRTYMCGTYKYSNEKKIAVNLSAGSISASTGTTICYNGNPGNITNSSSPKGGTGSYSYQWQQRVYSGGSYGSWTSISGATSSTYNPPALSANRKYRRRVQSDGQTKYTGEITYTVRANLSAGSISYSGSTTANPGYNPPTITGSTPSGGTGSYSYQWQKKTTGGYSNISGATGKDYNPPAQSVTTTYRRRVISCQTKYTNERKISIRLQAGAVSASTALTICSGANPGIINNSSSASGGTGSYSYQWESSMGLEPLEGGGLEGPGGPAGGWSAISGATGTTYNPPILNDQRMYRRKVTSGTEIAYSNIITYSISTLTSGGTITYTGGNINAGGNPSKITGSSVTLGSYQWQKKTTGGYSNITNATGRDYDPGTQTVSTTYRRKVVACGVTKYSNEKKIAVNLTAGSISASTGTTICYNGNPGTINNSTSPKGGTGSYSYQWQQRVYSGGAYGSWTSISGATSSTYNPPALTANRKYRRRVQSDGQTKYTGEITYTVRANLSAGTLSYSGSTLANPGYNPPTITGSTPGGGTGTYTYQWQKKTTGGFSNISGATSKDYNPPAQSVTTTYRRKVVSCQTKYTNEKKISIRLQGGSVTASTGLTICSGSNPGIINNSTAASGGTGSYSYQWESSNGLEPLEGEGLEGPGGPAGGWTAISGATGSSYDPPSLNNQQMYRRKVTSGTETAYSNTILYSINAVTSGGTITYSGGNINSGGNPAKITGSSVTLGSYQWQKKTTGGYSNITSATGRDYDPGTQTVSTTYRRKVVACGVTKYSNEQKVTVTLTAGSISASTATNICYSGNPGTINNSTSPTGGTGSYSYQWQHRIYSGGAYGSWTSISGATSSTYNPPALTANRKYRRRVQSDGQTKYTGEITYSVKPNLAAGTVSYTGSTTANPGFNPPTITGSLASGGDLSYSYQWQMKTFGGYSNITGATSKDYNPPAQSVTTTYRRKVVSCGQTKYSNEIKINIRLQGGSVTASTGLTICSGSNPGIINNSTAASGGTGSYSYQWESSNGLEPLEGEGLEGPGGPAGGWSSIPGATGSSYDPPSLNNQLMYRRKVTSGTETAYSNTIFYQIASITSGGTITYSGGNINSGGNPAKITGSSVVLASYQWQKKTTGGYSDISSATGRDYDPGTQTVSTTYRRKAVTCGVTKYSNEQKVTVTLTAGSISASTATNICYNGNPGTINNSTSPTGGTGSYSYQWQHRIYSGGTYGNWTSISGATSSTYNPPALTANRKYRRRVQSDGQTKYTGEITYAVKPNLNAGTASYSGSTSAGPGYNPPVITGSLASGGDLSYNYQWQKKTTGGYSNITGETGKDYDPPSQPVTTSYRRRVVSCGQTKYTNTITITTNLLAGSIGVSQIVCAGATPDSFVSFSDASGGTGIYSYQWQQSTGPALIEDPIEGPGGPAEPMETWSNIPGATGATFSAPTPDALIMYRRTVTSGTATAISNIVTLERETFASAGTISYSGGNINPGGNPSNISGTGASAVSATFQWQKKTIGGFSDISGATGTSYNPGVQSVTTSYRRKAEACGLTKYSNTVTISVNLIAGTISTNQTEVCLNEDVAAFGQTTASGGTGVYSYQWEKREYRPQELVPIEVPEGEGGEVIWAWDIWTAIPGATAASYDPGGQQFNTEYRRRVTSGGTSRYTNVLTLNLKELPEPGSINYVGGMIQPGIRPNNITGSTVSGSDFTYQWQKKTTGGFSDINGATTKNFHPQAIDVTTTYRRLVQRCNQSVASNQITVTVNLIPGEITSYDDNICHGCDPGDITAESPQGGSGIYSYQWQVFYELQPVDGPPIGPDGYADISGARSASYNPPPLFINTTYRRQVKSGGMTRNSQPITINVYLALNAGTINDPGLICSGDQPSLTASAATGGNNSYTYRWQRKNGSSWSTYSSSNTKNFTIPDPVTSALTVRRQVKSAGSSWKSSNQLTLNLYETVDLTKGILSTPNSSICPGAVVEFSFLNYDPTNIDNTKTFLQRFADGSWSNIGAISHKKTVQVRDGDKFRVRYNHPCGTVYFNELTFTFLDGCNLPPSLDQNFIRTEVAQAPISTELALSEAGPSKKQMAYSYMDGLGREVMEVAVSNGGGQEDVVNYYEYNELTGEATKEYLPYSKGVALPGSFQTQPISDLDAFYSGTPNIPSDTRYYAESITENSPLSRSNGALGEGQDWVTNDKKVVAKHLLYNAAGAEALPKWRVKSGGYPERDGIHSAKTLTIEELIDEEAVRSQTLTDQRGRKVAERTWVNGAWSTTYYVYDNLDRLRCVLPPQIATVESATNAEINKYGYLYKYDGFGRTIEKRLPGQNGWHYLLYDKWDRLVLTQDPNLRAQGKWLFTKYDQLNRPILTGLLSSVSTVSYLRTFLSNSVTVRSDNWTNGSVEGYSNNSYPNINASTELLTVVYYDNYNFLSRTEWSSPYDFVDADLTANHGGHVYHYLSTNDTKVNGLVTGTKTLNLQTKEWLKESKFYDNKGRSIQSVVENEEGGYNRISRLLDHSGNVLSSSFEHRKTAGSGPITISQRFEYDHEGRLTTTFHRYNELPEVKIGKNEYNPLGQLIRKSLHFDTQQSKFTQSIDYGYNIRGWLTNINDASLTEQGDLFGISLDYNGAAGLIGHEKRYDGNISAISWSDFKNDGTRAYTFGYDERKRIKNADHFDGALAVGAYGLDGINYDQNGNIESLNRYGKDGSAIDQLTYKYDGNRLKYVEDARGTEGFNDGHAGTDADWDYAYDDNGNQNKDLNKGISGISYNHLNLPARVDFANGDYITFAYNAAGEKLRQEVYEGGQLAEKKQYYGPFFYKDDELKFVSHGEGRLTFTGEGAPDYQYHLKDHLGNTRVTFSTTPESYDTRETFENDPGLFSDLHRFTSQNANTTTGGNKVSLLKSTESGALGLVSVNKGDKISLSAQANYETDPTGNTFVRTAFGALFSSFDGSYGSGVEGGVSGVTSSTFDQALSSAGMTGKDANNGAPRAFVNYLFFDRDMNFQFAGFEQISTAARGVGVHELVVTSEFVADKDGYVLGYLTNENQEPVDVHFDDFTIHQEKVNVVFASDYYPFGLQFNQFNRTAAEEVRFKFQGQEHDAKTGWVQFKWRNHQPDIGRFFNLDPLAEDYLYQSPYNFSENFVTTHVELEGKEAKYYMIDFNTDNTELTLYKTVDYSLIPNFLEPDVISVEVLGPDLTYTFTVAGGGGDPYCAGCGTGNNLDQFEAFAKDPLAAVYSNEYVTDQEILSDAAKDLIISLILARATRTAVPRRGAPPMTRANQTKGWKVGDPINNLTKQGNVPKWTTVRQRYWKNRADSAKDGEFSRENMERMKKGLAPQRYNPEIRKMESMELDHKPPQRDGGLFDFEEVWPDEHAAQDPFRHTGY